MFAVLVHVVGVEDGLEVVLHGAVLLGAEALLLVTSLHLLDEGLEELGILLGEVRLLLTLLLVLPGVAHSAGSGGGHGHSWLDEEE